MKSLCLSEAHGLKLDSVVVVIVVKIEINLIEIQSIGYVYSSKKREVVFMQFLKNVRDFILMVIIESLPELCERQKAQ